MQEKKIERIAGTRYVKINNKVFDTVGKDDTPTKTICECLNCGERFGGNVSGKCAMYCKNCRTQPERDAIDKENKKIMSK